MYKFAENIDEPFLRFISRKLLRRRHGAQDQLHFRNNISNDVSACPKCFLQSLSPQLGLFLAFSQQMPHQATKGLDNRMIGAFFRYLLEFTGDIKKITGMLLFAENLVYKARFADAGFARNVDHFC
ncbi:hypothetical protein D3C73_898720 [compost metagenome]